MLRCRATHFSLHVSTDWLYRCLVTMAGTVYQQVPMSVLCCRATHFSLSDHVSLSIVTAAKDRPRVFHIKTIILLPHASPPFPCFNQYDHNVKLNTCAGINL
jgi:hypothetical protein